MIGEGVRKAQSCPYCGSFTIEKERDICEVCYWEKERENESYPNKTIGVNKVSLNQAKENYKRYGACKEAFVPFVRNPRIEEINESVMAKEENY